MKLNIATKAAVNKLVETQKCMAEQDKNEMALVNELRHEGFKLMDELSISDTSLSIKTKHHSVFSSIWAVDTNKVLHPEPKHECSINQEMPKTNDEFQAMLKELETDRNQCSELHTLLAPIFLKDNYEKHLKYEEEAKQRDIATSQSIEAAKNGA